jgi:ubiquinone/menaquinone biosynthesis C-methylase UbiE
MVPENKFLSEVQRYISELTKRKDVVILDAATGAGETTLEIAQAMKGGKLITVDCDTASWEEWAEPVLKEAGVLERVEFLHADIRELPVESASVDLVVSTDTLSAMNIWAVDAIKEFHRVLKSSSRLALIDLIPENETECDSDNIAMLDWRLAKAAAHLSGEEHYEELPTEWIKARLADAGFEVVAFVIEPSRRRAGKTSYKEWSQIDLAAEVPDETLSKVIRTTHNNFIKRAEKEGLSTKTGYYACWARKT